MMKNHGQQYYSQVGFGCVNVLDVFIQRHFILLAQNCVITFVKKIYINGSEVSLDFGGHKMLNFTVICMSV